MLGSFLAPFARTAGGLVGEARSRTGKLVGSAAQTAGAVLSAPLRVVSGGAGDWPYDPTSQLRHALDLLRGGAREVWVGEGRLHVQLSVALSTDHVASARLETSLLGRRGVDWAAVNGVTHRVVVAYDPAEVTVEELLAVVDEVDEAWQETEAELPDHPADLAPLLRQLVSLGADAAGLAIATAGRYSRLPALPAGLTVTVGLLENAPRLRRLFEARLGTATADLALSVLTATVAGLGQGPLGPAIDLLHRAGILAEISARRATWERHEPELCADPTGPRQEPLALEPRPAPLPEGPIETYAERAWFASLAAAGITLPATRNLERASAALAAGMPKAARLGREAFATHLGRVLAQHGILAFDPGILRLLDRVDLVVVERRLLHPHDVRLIGEIVRVGDIKEDRVRERVAELFDPEDPDTTRRRGEWSLAPFEEATVDPGPGGWGASGRAAGPGGWAASGLRKRARELERRGSAVLVLSHGNEPVALVETRREQNALLDRMVAAVAEAGLALAFAASDADDVVGAETEWILPEGEPLVGSIQRLQRDGHVVCVVASRNQAALAAADVGIGIRRPGEPPPWTAHLLCRDDVSDALIVMEACAAAREVSIRSVRLAATGAGVGGFFVLRGLGATTRPVLVAVHIASLAALTNGAWTAISLGRRPRSSVPDRVPWHVLDAESVLERLETSTAGLSQREADRRRVLPGATRPSPLVLAQAVVEELNNPLTPILLAGAGLSVVVGSVADASMITGVVALNGLLGGLQRFRTERAIGELGRVESRRVTVVRDDELTVVNAAELVPGDVIRLEAGEGVPADCRILEGTGLEVDESTLTGESGTVMKSPDPSLAAAVAERSSMLYDGTYVAAGSATAAVVAVGPATEARRAFFVGEKQTESGVEARLNSLTSLTIPAALLSGVGVVGAGLLQGQPVSATARGGVGLVAAAVPEGLPLLATTAQLASAQRLSGRGALVRDPRSIEALGRVDLLCA
ncbi:MAG: heavy metal translocating P-type ATPase, partial [Actinomycetota bacterium]|nr:heavy metal translocating P-type ATPase [Actinomycetota bacterium]